MLHGELYFILPVRLIGVLCFQMQSYMLLHNSLLLFSLKSNKRPKNFALASTFTGWLFMLNWISSFFQCENTTVIVFFQVKFWSPRDHTTGRFFLSFSVYIFWYNLGFYQSCDLETIVSRLECTWVHFVQVSVLVWRPEVHSLGLGLKTACLVLTPVARLP